MIVEEVKDVKPDIRIVLSYDQAAQLTGLLNYGPVLVTEDLGDLHSALRDIISYQESQVYWEMVRDAVGRIARSRSEALTSLQKQLTGQ